MCLVGTGRTALSIPLFRSLDGEDGWESDEFGYKQEIARNSLETIALGSACDKVIRREIRSQRFKV